FTMHYPAGIYYIYGKAISVLPPILSCDFWPWLHAHQLLSRFRLWREAAVDALNWIWEQRTADGFWDLGSAVGRRPYSPFPLSESWRKPKDRVIDSTTIVLGLLSKCISGG